MSINYESELGDLLIGKLQELYGVKTDDIAYKIFLSRFYIEHMELSRKQWKNNWELDRKMPLFLISELNLPAAQNKLFYKNEKMILYRSSENSITNILDDWFFRYADTLAHNFRGESVMRISLVENEIKEIMSEVEKIIKVGKRDVNYPNYFKSSCLSLINHKYGIRSADIGEIEGFDYPHSHNPFKITLEEKYERLVHADMMKKGTLNKLSEEKLENYLIHNLHLIEDGMTLVSSQYIIDNGRLDILAKDKRGTFCIIELKVEDDTDLIFQCIYYRMAIKEKFKAENVRMITIAPFYPAHIDKTLKTLDNIEMFSFKAKMEHNEITQLKLMQVA